MINLCFIMLLQNTENELTNEFKPWDPLLFIDNNITEGNESVWLSVSYDALGQATVYQRRRVKRTFFERMELMDYPFDTQVRLRCWYMY